jgi:hypothetical protein
MMHSRVLILFILILVLLPGCATLRSDYEEPSVIVTDFRALPSEGVVPRFEIGLHIVNPNREPLNFVGMSYSIKLEGHKVLTGVSNTLPVVEGYGEGDVKLSATADLFGSIGLLTDMVRRQRETFSYALDIKMDRGGFRPNIRIRKEGSISLSPQQDERHLQDTQR